MSRSIKETKGENQRKGEEDLKTLLNELVSKNLINVGMRWREFCTVVDFTPRIKIDKRWSAALSLEESSRGFMRDIYESKQDEMREIYNSDKLYLKELIKRGNEGKSEFSLLWHDKLTVMTCKQFLETVNGYFDKKVNEERETHDLEENVGEGEREKFYRLEVSLVQRAIKTNGCVSVWYQKQTRWVSLCSIANDIA